MMKSMQEVSAITVVVAGREFDLRRPDVERAARDLTPEPIRDHYAVIAGMRFPPKQILAAITGLDRADFTTNQARAVLRRLGFATGRARAGSGAPAHAVEAAAPYRASEADVLRPHVGKWVALKDGAVLVASESPEQILAWLRLHRKQGDAMFRVPLDPSIDLGGFQ